MQTAPMLRCVSQLSSTDPLSVSALGYLPRLTALSRDYLWPPSFATFVERSAALRPSEGPLFPRLVASPVVAAPAERCPPEGSPFELSDKDPAPSSSASLLRLEPGLFAAYQRSLSPAIRRCWWSGRGATSALTMGG